MPIDNDDREREDSRDRIDLPDIVFVQVDELDQCYEVDEAGANDS